MVKRKKPSKPDAPEAFVRTLPSNKAPNKKESVSTGETQALPLYKEPNFVDDCIETVDKLIPKRTKG